MAHPSKPVSLATDMRSESSPGEMSSHIARVAARLFADRGFEATSVREIVEAAGVTKPTLYYHFGSKQGLAEALLTRPMKEFIAQVRDLLDHEADPVRLLRRLIAVQLGFVVDEPDRGRFLYAICFGPQNSSLQDEMHRFGEAIDAMTEACAGRLADSGVIDRDRIAGCAQMIRGMIMSSTLDHILLGRPLEPHLADRLVGDLLNGFAVPGFVFVAESKGKS